MPTLQIRDFPQELYDQLTVLAEKEGRSLAQQALVLLEEALSDSIKRKKKMNALQRLDDMRSHFNGITMEDVVAAIREDRDR